MFVLWWCGVCCEWVIELGTAHKGESLPCCVCIGKCEQAVWVSDVFQGGKDLEERVWSLLVLWSVHWWLLAELVYGDPLFFKPVFRPDLQLSAKPKYRSRLLTFRCLPGHASILYSTFSPSPRPSLTRLGNPWSVALSEVKKEFLKAAKLTW